MSRIYGGIPRDFEYSVGFGSVNGYSRVSALGHNPDVDIATVPEDIWEAGGTITWLSAASVLEALSSSANDTAAGTGARTVTINGLDSDYNVISEVLTLNGTSAVQTTKSFLRVNGFLISSAGSTETNVGAITLRVTGGGSTMSLIVAGVGFSRTSGYTVPAGFTLSVHSLVFSVNRSTGATRASTVSTFVRSPLGFYRLPLELGIYNENPYRHDGIPGIILPEKTDFCLRVTSTSADNTDITGGWLGILKSNSVS